MSRLLLAALLLLAGCGKQDLICEAYADGSWVYIVHTTLGDKLLRIRSHGAKPGDTTLDKFDIEFGPE